MRQIVFRIPLKPFDWLPDWLPDSIPIYGYGLMLFIAFIICTWVAGRRGQKEGVPREVIQDLSIWLFVGGLIGARVNYMLWWPTAGAETVWGFIKQFPKLWEGGVILYGAAIGGALSYALAYYFILRKRNLSGWKVADVAAPAIALGIALGRVGCLLNGCCYGQVACPHCPGVSFPFSATARFALVAEGYQSAAGFVTMTNDDDPRTVISVEPSTPTAEAGLLPGDVLLQIDGKDIDKIEFNPDGQRDKLREVLQNKHNVTLTVEREGKQLKLGPIDGLKLADFQLIDLRVVKAVEPGSGAAEAGLEPFDRILQIKVKPGSKEETHDVNSYQDLAHFLGNADLWPRGVNEVTLVVSKTDQSQPMITFARTLALYPTQLFETISTVLLFLLLTAYYPFRRNYGEVIALLMSCYAVHRYLNELLRSDKRPSEYEMYASILLIVAGVVIFIWRRYYSTQAKVTTA